MHCVRLYRCFFLFYTKKNIISTNCIVKYFVDRIAEFYFADKY